MNKQQQRPLSPQTSHVQDCCCVMNENDIPPMAVSILRSSKLWKWLLIVTVVLIIPLLSLPVVHFPRDPVDVEIKRKQVSVGKPNKTVVRSTSAPTQQPTKESVGGIKPTTVSKLELRTEPPTLAPAVVSDGKKDQLVVSNDNKQTEVALDDKESSSSDESTSRPASVPPRTNTTTPPRTAAGNDTANTGPASSPTNTTTLLPPYNREKANAFQNKWCILPETTEWFPTSSSEESWQLRAPRFMLIGARDSGTTSIGLRLSQHSSLVQKTLEHDFFSQNSFEILFGSSRENNDDNDDRIQVWPARQRMYARHYPTSVLKANVSLMSMDATPHYLLLTPHHILCVCPWIQMVVILRNPADRVYASYLRAVSKMGWRGTFEEYVALDMKHMERAGLFSTTRVNKTEYDAWSAYLKYSTADGPVGRSLYELQLRRWFQALREMGRDPAEAMLILRYEVYRERADQEYRRVLDFLGLPLEMKSTIVPTNNTPPSLVVKKGDEKTMKQLRRFFQPYNKRLYKLLGDEWKGCWDDD